LVLILLWSKLIEDLKEKQGKLERLKRLEKIRKIKKDFQPKFKPQFWGERYCILSPE
jgi:hypothetical protein